MVMDQSWDEVVTAATGLTVEYSGTFSAHELFSLIDRFFIKRGYEKWTQLSKETVVSSGKDIDIRIRPYKELKGKNVRREILIWLKITDMTETIKEIDGRKVRLNIGKVKIMIDCFLLYNLRGRWESRAEYVFIKTIFDKFLMKPASKDFEGDAKKDALDLKYELSSFLNLNKFIY